MQAEAKLGLPKSYGQQTPYGFFLFTSFVAWLIATLVMRLWGHTFFFPSSNLNMIAIFLLPLVCLPPFVHALFRWKGLQPNQYLEATICLAIPGMLLDVETAYFFQRVYPNVLPSADGPYGAWLLWVYLIVLVTGLATSLHSKLRKV
ncbi:DUF5367 domain-containing protein [Pseudanabaena sp. FACHB-2040]|nr:DUF5367 domain-containing protein [Pseudanabaena sp. FACHB-2040]